MTNLKSKPGLILLFAIIVFAVLGLNLLRGKLAKAPVAKTETEESKPSAPKPVVKFESMLVDPFAWASPVSSSIREPIAAFDGTSGSASLDGQLPNLPPPTVRDNAGFGTGPIVLKPDNLPGDIPDIATIEQPEDPKTNQKVDTPPPPPVRISVSGVAGGERLKAFVSVAGGGTRAVGVGSDLGEGIRVTAVHADRITVKRNGETRTIAVGKETEL